MKAWMAAVAILAIPAAAAGQATVPFGGLSHDASLPVEITSDRLDLDQASGKAVFSGTVKVGQGTLRMAADRIDVFYVTAEGAESGAIDHLVATGNVTLSNGTEAAESQAATYQVATGIVEMQGDVLLTQGQNALSSQSLKIDLAAGTGTLEGRVQTIFTPRSSPAP